MKHILLVLLQWKFWVEVGMLFFVLYAILKFLQGTRGAGIFRGMTGLVVFTFIIIFTIVKWLGLDRIDFLISGPIIIILLVIVVIFQPEVRRALIKFGEKFDEMRMFSRLFKEVNIIEPLVKASFRLSDKRIGALIAIEQDIGLRSYIEEGIKLDARVSAELIESIFYPGSALHDGAIIIRGDRIVGARCFFPLTENPNVAKALGTRHHAAVGITEESDAVTIVISEETGKVSFGVDGKLFEGLDRKALERLLKKFYFEKEEERHPLSQNKD